MTALRAARSLSARRAWIEIFFEGACYNKGGVALRKESVDRNFNLEIIPAAAMVALRKESVDRNDGIIRAVVVQPVALRKESVDRNPGRNHPW